MKKEMIKFNITPVKAIVFIVCTLIFSAKAQMPKIPDFNNNAFKTDLKGPVKSQLLNVFITTGLPDLRDVGYESYILEEKYTPQQLRTVENLFTTKNVLVAKSEILHDRNGFATEVIYSDLNGNMLNRITYEYMPNMNWKRTVNYDPYYNPLAIYYYYYSPEGYLSEIKQTNEEGMVRDRVIFVYDDRGNLSEQINYDGKGQQTADTEFLYNIKNKMISYRTMIGDDSIKVYSEANYQNDTLLTDMTLELYDQNKVISTIKYEYDPLGNILKTTETDLTGTKPEVINEYLYEWDLQGNWTKQLIKKNGDVEVAATRSITYYPE
ncbi:MAG: hypothetical protein RSE51_04530 [Bacteroidales bacterium]